MLGKIGIALEVIKLIRLIIEEVQEIAKDIKNPETDTTSEIASNRLLESARYAKDELKARRDTINQPKDY